MSSLGPLRHFEPCCFLLSSCGEAVALQERGNFVRTAGRLIYFSSFWLTSGVPSEPFCGPTRPGVGRAPLPTALRGRESRAVVLGEPAGKGLGRARPNAAQRSARRTQLRLSGSQSCSLRGPRSKMGGSLRCRR